MAKKADKSQGVIKDAYSLAKFGYIFTLGVPAILTLLPTAIFAGIGIIASMLLGWDIKKVHSWLYHHENIDGAGTCLVVLIQLIIWLAIVAWLLTLLGVKVV